MRCHLFAALLLAMPCTSHADANDYLFALSMEDLAQIKVNITTGTPKPLLEAPAAATVITAADIKAMGAQTLEEALESVPGLHVTRGTYLYTPHYFIRGIVSTYNPQTLLLVNGLPMTTYFAGDRGQTISNRYSLPVETIERIEVMRGPGSALYGADAFAGVINVITKGPDDDTDTAVRVSAGSFKTGTASLQQAGTLGPVSARFSLAYYETAGDHDAIISRDAQSGIDATPGNLAPPASLAPGPAQTSSSDYDARLDLIWNEFRLRSSWTRNWNIGNGQGLGDALDPVGRFESQEGSIDLGWHRPQFSQNWDVETRLSYRYASSDNPSGSVIYPPGAFFGTSPQGVISHPGLKDDNMRAGITTLYSGWSAHQLRLGSGISSGRMYDVHDVVNWMLVNGVPFPVPRPGGFQDISGTPEVFLPESRRQNRYLFAQDECALAQDWQLTTGVRYDQFSDVGSTTNPRVALVWTTTPTFTSKLLYGEAFRPPAFFELYGRGNKVALGNPELKPEKIRNAEIAFNWRPLPVWALDMNIYQYRIHDYIDFVQDPGGTYTARNASHITGHGLEAEVRHQVNAQIQILANYSYQATKNLSTGQSLGIAPGQQAYLRTIWELAPRWQLTSQLEWVGARKRAAGDTRAALPGYTTFGFALRKTWHHDLELALSARNLFDADVSEASRGPGPGQTTAAIPDDLPQAGRSIIVESSMHW